VRNLEIDAQFPDSKNAQRNLEIAQIPKLRETHTYVSGQLLNIAMTRYQGTSHDL